MEDRYPEIIREFSSLEKGHGRIEERKISVIATDNAELNFEGVKQVAKLVRKREVIKSGVVSEETVILITNLDHAQADPERIMQLKREYWAIENQLHYRKDFVFGEDRSTIRAEHGPQNMATLRNFAVSLMMASGVQNIKRCVDNLRYQRSEHVHSAFFH